MRRWAFVGRWPSAGSGGLRLPLMTDRHAAHSHGPVHALWPRQLSTRQSLTYMGGAMKINLATGIWLLEPGRLPDSRAAFVCALSSS